MLRYLNGIPIWLGTFWRFRDEFRRKGRTVRMLFYYLYMCWHSVKYAWKFRHR